MTLRVLQHLQDFACGIRAPNTGELVLKWTGSAGLRPKTYKAYFDFIFLINSCRKRGLRSAEEGV